MKNDWKNLAIFGGVPASTEKLHVGRPNIGNRQHFLDRVNDMLDRRWLSNNGPYVQELEKKLAEMLGVRQCIAVCNATVALEIVIRALNLSGEVIVPSFTFIATAHSLEWQQITPVFCDIDPKTHNLDPQKVEKLITPQTTGIIGVHVWGRPCAISELGHIAQAHNLKLIFDAAHALGCSHNGIMIGNFGEAEVFSFHATKFINSFEGGAIATNNGELAQKIRLMKNFGFAGYDDVIHIGTNGKMTEVSAAMGLTSLESMDEFISANYRNYLEYQKQILTIPGSQLIKYNLDEKNNFQYIIVEVDEQITGISRDNLVKILHAENVLARRYFHPGCHHMEPYRSLYPQAKLLLPNTEELTQRVMSLPNGTTVSKESIDIICGIFRLSVENGDKLTKYLSSRGPQ